MAERYPDRLCIELDALATRVLLDERNRAIGVEYLKGERLYRAHARARATRRASCARHTRRREVILAGGAFNTPQLLMLSGIGPRAELERLGIAVRVDLPGVGRNLQDRYEVCVVNRMRFAHWEALAEARFEAGDPLHRAWARGSRQPLRHQRRRPRRDHALRARPRDPGPVLHGAARPLRTATIPGYAARSRRSRNHMSWSILKAHTENRAGTRDAGLGRPARSAQGRLPLLRGRQRLGRAPTSTPWSSGIRFVRQHDPPAAGRGPDRGGGDCRAPRWTATRSCAPSSATTPGATTPPAAAPSAGARRAACWTATFGSTASTGLRVVDASVFPRIPGFFIASAVYMIGEKAADVILAQSRGRAAA